MKKMLALCGAAFAAGVVVAKYVSDHMTVLCVDDDEFEDECDCRCCDCADTCEFACGCEEKEESETECDTEPDEASEPEYCPTSYPVEE